MDHDPNQELNPNALMTGVVVFFLFALTTVGYIIYASESAMADGATAAAPAGEASDAAPAEAKKGAKSKAPKSKGGDKGKTKR